MFQRNILADRDVEKLGEGIFEVLEKVGVLCQNKELLEILEIKGAKVDYQKEVFRLPRKMTKEYLGIFRKESIKGNENGFRKFSPPFLPVLGTQVAQFFYDYEKKEKHSGNKKDFINLIKFGDVLHQEDGVGHCLLLTEVPPILEPLESSLILAEYAHKPGACFAWNVNQIDYLIEMGEILGIKDWFDWGAICFAHPFRFDKDVADKFVRRVKLGYPTGLTSMAVAGATAPVTIEGYIVVASAEHIATWISARAINPKVELCGSMWGGTVDMKTGAVSYSSFDSMIYAYATVEFLRRWCGINVSVGGGEYCNAKLPGLYAVLEKAYKSMIMAIFSGSHPVIGQGMLECGKTICPEQFLLEREFGQGIAFLAKEIKPTDENIGLENIFEIGCGIKKNYLECEHTLKHFRSFLWNPVLFDRSGWNGFEWEKSIMDKTHQKVKEIIFQYKKPEVDPGKLEEIKKVLEKAKKNLR